MEIDEVEKRFNLAQTPPPSISTVFVYLSICLFGIPNLSFCRAKATATMKITITQQIALQLSAMMMLLIYTLQVILFTYSAL